MNGVSNPEGKAERARIEEKLYYARRYRDDMIREHTYQIQVQGLEDMEEDIDETLDKTLRSVESNS